MGENEYIHLREGRLMTDDEVNQIVQQYGSYENWKNYLNRTAVGRGMTAAAINKYQQNLGRGDKAFKERQKQHQEAGIGMMNKVIDATADVFHYVPDTAVAMDMLDMVQEAKKPQDEQNVDSFMSNLASGGGQVVKTMGEQWAKKAKTGSDAATTLGLTGYVGDFLGAVGMIEDMGESIQLAKDMVKTPNAQYKSKYFPEQEDTTPAYPAEVTKAAEAKKPEDDDNPWMLPD